MWLVLSAGDAWCDARMDGVQQMNVSVAVEYGKGWRQPLCVAIPDPLPGVVGECC